MTPGRKKTRIQPAVCHRPPSFSLSFSHLFNSLQLDALCLYELEFEHSLQYDHSYEHASAELSPRSGDVEAFTACDTHDHVCCLVKGFLRLQRSHTDDTQLEEESRSSEESEAEDPPLGAEGSESSDVPADTAADPVCSPSDHRSMNLQLPNVCSENSLCCNNLQIR